MKSAELITTQESPIRPDVSFAGYVIGELLGSGGMSTVFTAFDVKAGKRFALKTLLPNVALNSEYFRLEIQILRGLQHDGIVPLRDHGVFQGQAWYVMDLLSGATLRDALESRGSASDRAGEGEPRVSLVPASGLRLRVRGGEESAEVAASAVGQHYASLEALIDVGHDVLDALAYLHSRGISHGDIKPENIFLRPGRSAVLVDFGVASSFDAPRERLALTGRSLGSVSYMAPERLRGALPDARADLYALGCILYECLTGQHPFLRATVDATKLAHLRASPPPPSALRPDIPQRLDALVMRLLSRAPADRPGYAVDVSALLSRDYPVRRQRANTPQAANDAVYLFRAPLVGREVQLAVARKRLSESGLGRGGSILISGGEGMGKTRLVLELIDIALDHDALVLHIECAAPIDAQTKGWLQPLQALQRALQEHGHGGALLGLDTAALDTNAAYSAERSAALQNSTVQELLNCLLAVEHEHTILLVLDGVHHADEATRDLLLKLCQSELSKSHLLLVATAAQAPFDSEQLAAFGERLELPPLSEAEVEVALRSLLAVEFPSPSLVRASHQISEGSPAILRQYLRALLEAGELRRNRHQGWHLASPLDGSAAPSALPAVNANIESIASLFLWRARELEGEELRLAGIVALLESAFDPELLAAVARVEVESALRVLGTLQARSVVERQQNGSYRMSHALLSRALRDRVPAATAKRIHRRAAAVYWRSRAEPGVGSVVLARHLRACGARRKAARCFADAARFAMHTHRRHDALEWFGAAIDELQRARAQPGAAQGELLPLFEQRGDVAMGLRSLAEAQSAYESALASAPADEVERARLHRKLAAALQRDRERAVLELDRAILALGGADQRHHEYRFEWLQVHLDRMWVHYWKQETARLLAIADLVAADVERFGTAVQRASLHFNLAVGLMQKNRYVTGQEELDHIARAMSLYEELDARPNVAMCRFLRSMLLLFSDRIVAAEEGFRAVLAISEKATSVTIRVRALMFLCLSRRKQRDTEGVRKLASSAYSLASEHDMLEYQGTAMANLAWVALQDGALDESEQLIDRAIEAWEVSPLNVFRWTALLPRWAIVMRRAEEPGDASTLRQLTEALLDESQQRLPDGVTRALEAVRAAHDASNARVRWLSAAVVEQATCAGLL